MRHRDLARPFTVAGLAVQRRTLLSWLAGAAAWKTLASPAVAWAAGSGAILQIGSDTNPSSLDPATGGSGADHIYLYTIYDTLVTWTYDTLEARPGLAKSWEYTDPKTLVLQLRNDVTFHDGAPLNAEAVKVNLDRNRSADFSNIRADLASVDEITADGEHTVTLHLKTPDAALPLILSDRAGMMVSPKALEENDNRVDRKPVGAGFMRFDKWNDGSEVVVSAYENYHDADRVKLGGIRFKIMTDDATRLRAVMSGQADIAYQLTGRQVPLIEKSPKLHGVTGPTLYCYQLYLNTAKKPLDDKRVRQALNYAIDRTAFVKGALAGAGEPAYMNLPESHWAWDAETAALYSHDPDKARALLEEAGHADGISLDLAGYSDQSSVQMQEILLHQLAQAGIKARFSTGTIPEMSAAYFARKEHDALLSAWTGRPDPALTYSLLFTEDAYYNAGHTAPPEGYDDALLAARSTEDLGARKKAFAKVQQLAMDNALVVPIAFRQDIIATNDKVEGVRSNLLGKPKFKDVSLDK